MTRLNTLGAFAAAMLAGLGACTAPPSATDLHTAGPPTIEQVMMTEEYLDTQGTRRTRPLQLAFGHHDDPAFAEDDGKVVTAVADPGGQSIRVVMDHLLVGNALEMVECRAKVDLTAAPIAQSYSKVPYGATPDDLANCSGAQDLVFARCVGDHAVCINNTGITQITAGTGATGGVAIPPGMPAGIEDEVPAPDGDGVPDLDLFIDGSVRIMCKGVGGKMVEAPLDLTGSYWQPSGNQQVPAHGGVAALGPALVLKLSKGLPTGSQCTFVFDPSVQDKDGNPVCAPPGGDPNQDCPAVGDTSLVSFGVAALRRDENNGNQPADGDVVPLNEQITVRFNTTMDAASLASGIKLTENGAPKAFTVQQVVNPMTGAATLTYQLNTTTPLTASSTYVETIEPTVTDFAGQPLGGAPIVTNFTTGP